MAHSLWSVPSSNAAWAPLDLPSFVAEHLPVKRERMFWKLVLVLPDGEEQTPESSGRSGGFLCGEQDAHAEKDFSAGSRVHTCRQNCDSCS